MNGESRNAGTELRDSTLTARIIASAVRVHRELGPGFLESIYEAALAVDFGLSEIQYERQKTVSLAYRSHPIGEHRLDFLVERSVIVELKAVSKLDDIHFAIVRSYLKACSLENALLLNFSEMPLKIRRVFRERRSISDPTGNL